MGIQRVPNLLRWTVLACCLPYPGDPKSAIDCSFLFGISLHPGVTGSAPHWKFRGCRVHSFPSPQELLRPASWLALLSRTFTFELAPTRSPSISVEYDYVDKQSIPTAGLSPASPTALWAAGHLRVPPIPTRRVSEGRRKSFARLRGVKGLAGSKASRGQALFRSKEGRQTTTNGLRGAVQGGRPSFRSSRLGVKVAGTEVIRTSRVFVVRGCAGSCRCPLSVHSTWPRQDRRDEPDG